MCKKKTNLKANFRFKMCKRAKKKKGKSKFKKLVIYLKNQNSDINLAKTRK